MYSKEMLQAILDVLEKEYDEYCEAWDAEKWVGYDSQEAENDGWMKGRISMLESMIRAYDAPWSLLKKHGIGELQAALPFASA